MSSEVTVRRLFQLAFLVVLVLAGFLLLQLYASYRLPGDAPLARMYRTEADLRGLVKALETYREAFGAYPPGGPAGLRAATDHLSRHADYMPDGPPVDAWGRPFRYVPAREYDAPDAPALRDESGRFAPDTYQLYSVGRDGVANGDPGARADNITSWEPSRPWRAVYQARNREFMGNGGEAE